MSQYTPVPFKEDEEKLTQRMKSLSIIENRLVSKENTEDYGAITVSIGSVANAYEPYVANTIDMTSALNGEALYGDGMVDREIAAVFHCRTQTVQMWRMRCGTLLPTPATPPARN